MSKLTFKAEIEALKKELGKDLCIMGHHYQSDDVIDFVDRVGDSLELARMVDTIDAKHIVFCGVNFMAEGTCLLTKEGQEVHIPDEKADCVMAQMTPAHLLDTILAKLNKKAKVIPIAYVNTPLAVKAIVGKYGGAVCTSANAQKMLAWALKEAGEDGSVLFLPDANLATNTADILNISREKLTRLDIRKNGENLLFNPSVGGQILLWPGCCAVHAKLKEEHIHQAREKYPHATIVLHPECSPNIVKLADYAGSTSFIIKLAEEMPDNATLIIGTEVNLVNRLAKQHAGRIHIHSLKDIACSNMAKITQENLYQKLKEIKEERALPFTIDTSLKENALLSLTRMLEAC